jgi:hypothetical protein
MLTHHSDLGEFGQRQDEQLGVGQLRTFFLDLSQTSVRGVLVDSQHLSNELEVPDLAQGLAVALWCRWRWRVPSVGALIMAPGSLAFPSG